MEAQYCHRRKNHTMVNPNYDIKGQNYDIKVKMEIKWQVLSQNSQMAQADVSLMQTHDLHSVKLFGTS